MKRTVKEIKKTVNVFITADGKEFDDYEDALNYELDLFLEADELRMFDGNGLVANLDDCEVVVFKSRGALEIFLTAMQYEDYETTGIDLNSELGLYMWEYKNRRGWHTPKALLESMKDELNETIENCGGELLE